MREEIIKMAREAGFDWSGQELTWESVICTEELERFFHMAQAAEREACHALRQSLPNPHEHCQVSAHAYDMALVAYGAAIRARGQA